MEDQDGAPFPAPKGFTSGAALLCQRGSHEQQWETRSWASASLNTLKISMRDQCHLPLVRTGHLTVSNKTLALDSLLALSQSSTGKIFKPMCDVTLTFKDSSLTGWPPGPTGCAPPPTFPDSPTHLTPLQNPVPIPTAITQAHPTSLFPAAKGPLHLLLPLPSPLHSPSARSTYFLDLNLNVPEGSRLL